MKFLDSVNNLNEEVSNEKYSLIIKRLKKRALLIYNALSEGHVVVKCYDSQGLNYKLLKLRYVLPENPRINIEDRFDDNDKIVEYGTLMGGDSVKMYYSQQGFSGEVDWYDAVDPIRKKFRALDIQIVFDGIDLIEEKPLNEEVSESEELRLKKRTELIFRALQTGVVETVVMEAVDSDYIPRKIKVKYKVTKPIFIRISKIYEKKDGFDLLDSKGNPVFKRYRQLIQIPEITVDYERPKTDIVSHNFIEKIKDNLTNTFNTFGVQCQISTVRYYSDDKLIDEAVLRKPEKQDISPEERERIEKKVNVVMKAITKMPFTILEHKVKIKIPDYRMVLHPPNIIKFTNEFDQPEYQVTESDVRIHADDAFVYTNSEETYKYFTNEVKRDDLIYKVYHAIRNRLQKFNISFTLFDAYIRFEDEDNDLQEQLDDFEPDEYIPEPDEFTPDGTEAQKKKLKVIYKALKEGVIRVSFKHKFINCRYVLPNKVKAVFDKNSRDIIIKMPKYGFELYDEDNVLINPRTDDKNILTTYHNAYRVISQRFQKHFGVMFERTEDFYGDLQEQDDDNPITDKDRKKIRAVFTAFANGVIIPKGPNPKIRYSLVNHYMIKKSSEKKLSIVLVGKSFENVKIYIINEDGTETQVVPFDNMWNGMLWIVGRRIEALFNRYDIGVVLNLF